ncbi:hypothetical protein CHS0354_025963 [Potamilus streckersoni]|uniref:Uncharacterized protein n=1 Tax=Potamilus streckersoni TaxID=2493646 RepID=A0AAE0T3Y3_9BIVA|nr:hypothetical protein CHS0354_025963 [Potamilus streckersoni]
MSHIALAPLLVAMVMGEGCCPPDAWEGVVGLMIGSVKGKNPHLTKGVQMWHQNVTLGMIAIEEELLVDGLKMKLKVIQDYNKKNEYFIKDGKCTKMTLVPSIPRCLPENATLVENTYFGAGSENVAVKIYRFNTRGLETYFTVTANDCIPVMEIASGTLPNAQVMKVSEYTGISLGVKDPSVLNIPAICQSVEDSAGYVPIMSRWRRSDFH